MPDLPDLPDLTNGTDQLIFALPGEVRAPQLNGDDLLTLARRRAPDPTIFDERAPFFWLAEISNDNLDSYFSRMHDSTLKHFARDATKGVSFQNSHRWRELGLGQSLAGAFLEDGDRHRVEASFYTVPGLRLNELDTDEFIAGVRSGIVRDVSVGFHGGEIRCGICGGELFAGWFGYFGECKHVPGLKYEVDGKKTIAVAWHHNSELSEVSAVYDGATPDAGILKAQLMAEAGRLTPEEARYLEATPLYRRHRVAFPNVGHRYRLGNPAHGGRLMERSDEHATEVAETESTAAAEEQAAVESEIPAETTIDEPAATNGADAETATESDEVAGSVADNPLAAERARLAAHGIRLGRDVAGAVRVLADEVLRLRECAGRLEAEAADGRVYRADLIEQLHTEGVRAFGGERYDRERWGRIAGTMSIAELKATIADFAGKGAERFPGGRETHEHDAERGRTGTGANGRSDVPDAAFKTGRRG
jgi:hypothetical protein